jgi:hypothetical protein
MGKKRLQDSRHITPVTCCPVCCLPHCMHSYCINTDCEHYFACTCERVYRFQEGESLHSIRQAEVWQRKRAAPQELGDHLAATATLARQVPQG